ncbi:SCO family protein [Hymenobacter terrenus]|uniref:SCO family protein n=1 Tax=Hymenobacter terrenus TaxID=1629124 RepID=UPI000619046C|nr:SCO family protein [Hymenobacter terrenus]
MKASIVILLGSWLALAACSSPNKPAAASPPRLPFLGFPQVVDRPGQAAPDTVPAVVPPFRLFNQDGQLVTNATFAGKVYVANFFFATCPSICPPMQHHLLTVFTRFAKEPRVSFLSHTIDPAHDSLPVLRDYAQRLGVPNATRWHFARTSRDTVFTLARSYMTGAQQDVNAPGGFAHSGTFALVDPQGHIRGLYNGLDQAEVQRLIGDIPRLLREVDIKTPAQP